MEKLPAHGRRATDSPQDYAIHHQLLLATMPAVLWSADPELRITFVAGRMEAPAADGGSIVGRKLEALLPPGSEGLEAHRRALGGETVTYDMAYGEREFAAAVGPMHDAHGQIVGVAGAALDVTRELAARRSLVESEARNHQIHEASPLPTWAFDAATRRFVMVNDAAIRLYGFSRAEFLSMRVDDVRDASQVPALLELVESLQPGGVYITDSTHRTKDGRSIDVQAHYYLTAINARAVVVSGLVDMTERKRLNERQARHEEQLRRVLRRLISLQEEERRSIAADLHDRVGQALSALGIQLSILGSLDETSSAPIQRLLREAEGILAETGQAVRGVIAELRPEALYEFGLVGALRNLEAQARERYGFALDIQAADASLRLPSAVESALHRICQEAIANAAKHSRARHVRVAFRATRHGAALRILDDGRGFPLSSLQGPEKLSRWGLLMMRERADSIGARLRVRSAPGRGTMIVVSWRARFQA